MFSSTSGEAVKALAVGALLLIPTDAFACATCVGFPWSKADHGIYWSALFLMGVPIVIAGLIGGWLYYHFRRAGPGQDGVMDRFVALNVDRKKENEE
jgi:hypothetical protein